MSKGFFGWLFQVFSIAEVNSNRTTQHHSIIALNHPQHICYIRYQIRCQLPCEQLTGIKPSRPLSGVLRFVTHPISLEVQKSPKIFSYMDTQTNFLLKVFIISAGMSWLIKYSVPGLHINPTSLNAMIIVLAPTLIIAIALGWRAFKLKSSISTGG